MSVKSIVSLVAGKIGQLLVDEVTFLYGVKDKLKSLETELNWMRRALFHLEAEHHKSEDGILGPAIEEIRDIAYEIQDVIDSYITDEVDENDTSKLMIFARCCSCLVQTHETGTKVDAIGKSIEKFTERLNRYRVLLGSNGTSGVPGEQSRVTNKRPPQSYPFEDMDEKVVGLEEDVNNLVDKLTTINDRHFYCIHGMGGSGKTTLARKIYNHPTIKIQFEHLVWISVSQEWSSIQILSEIFKKTGGKEVDERMLTEDVRTNLRNKRYLIVLDDVWTAKVLQEILPATPLKENQGSKIIITTRNEKTVPSQDLTSDYFKPKKLDPEQSMELFKKIVLGSDRKTFDSNEYENLGEEMLKKCDGLPLAIIALGGILRTKENIEDWEKVEKDVSFKVMKGGGGILYGPVKDMLALSYYDLPDYLKPCFLYLGFFPEDSEIPVGTLIRMWMAEGFVTFEQRCREETFEDAAVELVEELVQRCMVQVSGWKLNRKVNKIKIHDLFRELSISMAKDLRFLKVFEASSMLDNANPKQPRRASAFFKDEIGMQGVIRWFEENSSLRSINLEDHVHKYGFGGLRVPITSTWRLLMVLRLVGVGNTDGTLSTEIGGLALLRYLELKDTNIHQLPESIGNLRNLLTLDYRNGFIGGKGIMRLPNSLGKLRNLRHLFLPHDIRSKWEIYPERSRGLGLQHLKNLTILSGAGGIELKRDGFLSWSQNIRKLEIRVSSTQEVQDLMSSCPCFLPSGSLLASLFLFSSVSERILLPNLQPLDRYCKHLQKLRLDEFSLVQTTFFPSTLIVLRLRLVSFDVVSLKAIEKLPLLKCFRWVHSSLEGNNKWICESGAFPQLQELEILHPKHLEEWICESGAFPQLQQLEIVHPTHLKEWICGSIAFPQLQQLEIVHPTHLKEWICGSGAFPQLQQLEIVHPTHLEEWICGSGAFPRLQQFEIVHPTHLKEWICESGAFLQLQQLVIVHPTHLKEWICGSGAFPQLQQLEIVHPKHLEEWRVEKGSLPRLTRLSITGCDKLERMVIPDEEFIKRLQHCFIQRVIQVLTWDEFIDEFKMTDES